jgi:nucleoside-diphosphate-sugar epimerase
MSVLVTGATGLVGGHVVDVLAERGVSIAALVRPGEDADVLASAGVEIRRGDLCDRASLVGAVRGVDCVLHCAAKTGPWGSRSDYERVNVRGLEDLLDASLDAGVERFVHVSSIAVFGNDVGGVADETSPLHVDPNPYGWSKVQGERLMMRAIQEYHAPVTIVRPGWVYGPRDAGSFGRFVAKIEQGSMVVIGSGNNHVPLIYVRDVAEGIVLASEVPEAVGRDYLLVNDERVTQRDYLDTIAAELGVSEPKLRIPYRLALMLGFAAETVGQLARWQHPPPLTRFGVQLLGGENWFVIDRARKELGFVPRTDLAAGVREGVAWYRTKSSKTVKEKPI